MGERMKLLILTLVLFAFGLILGSGMKLMTWIDGPSAHPPAEGPYRHAETWECKCKEIK